ncbi:class I SAM-dependent methyltransferase [Actinomyces bowdenii]|uniref:class I SAM-dependent methyltransferase n=1 Tax=Actinomyces bowdenii TaxID=131109 RepID=UPI001ABCEF96|nr:class I SAM-dependent methyltransferase [Actinomyces bowdenii]MBO3724178.1 class I SAM-dependent methyltransferase [Actinomyces bowdenii]
MDNFIDASEYEIQYSSVFTQSQVVGAYTNWNEFSETESELLSSLLPQTDKVLDLGCGAGRASLLVPKATYYVGVDLSAEMINSAKIRFPDRNFIQKDILEYLVSLNADSFDCVLLLNNVIDILHPLERRKMVLSEIKRILISDGNLVLSSHILSDYQPTSGYYKEMYHGNYIQIYRSRHSSFIRELEEIGYGVIKSAIDYRDSRGDWVYVYAKVHSRS